MRTILLSALLGLGLGLAGTAGAAPIGAGLNGAGVDTAMIQEAHYYRRRYRRPRCRTVHVCHRTYWGHRRCYRERICRW